MVNPKSMSSRPGLTLITLTAMALAALLCCQPKPARADTIQTLDVSGSFTPENGYTPTSNTFSGTLTVDTTTGMLTAADITFPGPFSTTLTGPLTFDTVPPGQTYSSQGPWTVSLQALVGSSPYYTLDLAFNDGAFSNALLSQATLQADGGPIIEELAYSNTPQATPEPGCALLAGLGLICLAGLSWKLNRRVHI